MTSAAARMLALVYTLIIPTPKVATFCAALWLTFTLPLTLVLESGGAWPDHEHDVLFEVCFLSIAGLGFGAKSAVKNWIVDAERQFSIDKVA
jgi:hypothetical protein